jgi:hypothetical protein
VCGGLMLSMVAGMLSGLHLGEPANYKDAEDD